MSISQRVIRRKIERELTPAHESAAIEAETQQYEYKEK